MADQNITELPIKTNSGVASTDYMLGIDSAEGYQILVRDVAKYIVENYNGSTILGSAQTVNDAFNTVNSNAYMLNRQNYITSGNLDTFTTCGIYNSSTSGQTANIEGQPTGHPTAGFKLLVEYLGNNTIVKQTIVYNGGETYQRIKSGTSSWSTWQLQPTRAEITELNSNIDITVTSISNDNYTLSVEGEHCKRGLCVTLNIAIAQSAQSSSYIKIASIPSVYAPKGWIYMTVGTSDAMVGLSPTGEIFARGNFSRREYINLTYASK